MIEAVFHAALLNPALPVPAGLADPASRQAGRRFAVYRNNIAVSLRAALAEGFPLLRQLLGDRFFDAMAGEYLRVHLPASPVLWQYGADMPDFLRGFAPVAHLPYLPDVARLELALRHSYHAADAAPVPAETLAELPAERLLGARLRLAPALVLVRSDWPIHGIWRGHSEGGTAPVWTAEDVAVMRPEFDPEPHLLPPGGAAFVAALQSGQRVEQAIDMAGPDHSLTGTLAILLRGNAIVAIEE